MDLDRFRMQSLRREAFWINKYAAQGPAGLNTAFTPGSQATQQRRQRRKVGKIELGQRTQRHTFTGAPGATKDVAVEPSHHQKRIWLYFAQRNLCVVQGAGPFRRHREALTQYLLAKQNNEDATAFVVEWERSFRLSLLDWFSKQVKAINGDLALIQAFTTDLCSTPLRPAEQELLRLQGKPPHPVSLHPDVVKKKKSEEKPVWLKVEWKNNDMEKVEIARILRVKQVRDRYPEPMVDARIRMSYTLGRPLGSWMASVQRDSEIIPGEAIIIVDPRSCPCQKFRTGAELELAGHVVTTEPGCFTSQRLRQL